MVLMLHGCPAPAASLAPLLPAVSASHRVLVPDLPGYGGEPALAGPDRFARTTDALVELLDARGILEVDVVGFSSGALRAVALAAAHPRRVRRLVLLGAVVEIEPATRAGASRSWPGGATRC